MTTQATTVNSDDITKVNNHQARRFIHDYQESFVYGNHSHIIFRNANNNEKFGVKFIIGWNLLRSSCRLGDIYSDYAEFDSVSYKCTYFHFLKLICRWKCRKRNVLTLVVQLDDLKVAVLCLQELQLLVGRKPATPYKVLHEDRATFHQWQQPLPVNAGIRPYHHKSVPSAQIRFALNYSRFRCLAQCSKMQF